MIASLVDPKVFEDLQTKLDDDAKTREQIRDSLQILEKEQKSVLSALSSAHSIANCRFDRRRCENYLLLIMFESVIYQGGLLAHD